MIAQELVVVDVIADNYILVSSAVVAKVAGAVVEASVVVAVRVFGKLGLIK